jgi:hypothetical protein
MPPRARLSAPLNVPVNESITLDATASFDPDGSILEYTFSFSDGSAPVTQSTPEIAHVFSQAGAYEVAVVVRDDGGLLARATQLVVVRSDAPSCSNTSDCSLGAECREHLCYSMSPLAGTGAADCNADTDCNSGFTCRAGLCLSAQTATR